MDEKREALEESEIVMAAWNYQNRGFCSHACTVEKLKGVRPKQSGCDKKVCHANSLGQLWVHVLLRSPPKFALGHCSQSSLPNRTGTTLARMLKI
jgi:hypothetical protein